MVLASAAVAERVRRWRLQRGWTAQQLADECARAGLPALTRSTVAKIESGVRKSVSADEVAVLSRALGVTPAALLGNELGSTSSSPEMDSGAGLGRRSVIVVDIADFGRHSPASQLATRDALFTVLRQSFENIGVTLATSILEDRGDGMLIVLDVPPERLSDELPHRLAAALTHYNATQTDESRLRLLMAMSRGVLEVDRHGLAGSALLTAFRLANSSELRAMLAESGGVLALALTDDCYREITRAPEDYRSVAVTVKEFSQPAWIRVFESAPRLPAWVDDRAEKWLSGLLTGNRLVYSDAAYRVATRRDASPPEAGADPRALFARLAQRDVGPDGVPPALIFTACLAIQAPPRLAAELRSWTRAQATRLGVADHLGAITPELPRLLEAELSTDACLTVQIDHDALDPNAYVVSEWRLLGGDWPVRGETVVCSAEQLSRRVSGLVAETEAGWAATTSTLRLEFVLPSDLLNLPVDQWLSDATDATSVPLGVRYQMVVRSAARMRETASHRLWRMRWDTMTALPIGLALANDAVLTALSNDSVELRRLAATLAVRRERASVLLTPPPAHRQPLDAVRVGLHAGVPVFLWYRGARPFPEIEPVLHELVTSAGDIREHVRVLRADAFMADDPVTSIGSEVTLLWDDPRRVLVIG